jgi:hypothetical protein
VFQPLTAQNDPFLSFLGSFPSSFLHFLFQEEGSMEKEVFPISIESYAMEIESLPIAIEPISIGIELISMEIESLTIEIEFN